MAIQFNDSIYLDAGKPLDDKFGPYADISAANTAIPQSQRHIGLIFGIYTTPLDLDNSDVEYYCYVGALGNSDYRKLIKPTLQEITNNGNSTTLKISHADATQNNESATLGQVVTLINNAIGSGGGGGGGISAEYVPYTGATKDTILGDFSITADSYRFDLTPLSTQAKGRLLWDENSGSLTLGLNTNVINTLGLDDLIFARNQTGTQIPKGRVVSIIGSSSANEKLLIALSVGDGSISSNRILGITAENISNNGNGYVATRGRIRGINTTGSIYSETWVNGDLLYLNPSTNGGLTKTRPSGPRLKGLIAIVVKVDSTDGILEIKQNITENLGEINNVTISSLANRNLLTYNTSTSVWENRTLEYILNGTSSQFVKGNGTLDSTVYQPLITGAATTITSSNLTANRVIISDNAGKVAVTGITTTELLSLSGITGNIQNQINSIIDNSILSENILKEGFEYVSGNTITLSQLPDEIHSVNVNGQYISEDYYNLSGNTVTFTDIIFETEPEPDQIWVYYFKEMS
jgi:hypothetical protein